MGAPGGVVLCGSTEWHNTPYQSTRGKRRISADRELPHRRQRPIVLATGLAIGAIVALALTLMTSVRRRRRDLALLKTLGFTRRQLAATVASQASIVALLGAVVGVPVGIVAGRSLWTRFARDISAVPKPTVPTLSVAIVAIGAFVLANLVAAIPARQAARTPSATLLHEE